jgi:hypothetical protein
MEKKDKAFIVQKLVEAYNTNAFDILGDLLAEDATLEPVFDRKCENRKEVVRYYQDLAEANWKRGWLDTAQAANDEQGDAAIAILADDLASISETLHIGLDAQGRIKSMVIYPFEVAKVDLVQEELLDRNGIYRKALYPIMRRFEEDGYRVAWMSSEASSDVSIGLTLQGRTTTLHLSVGMWPLNGPMPDMPAENEKQDPEDDSERRWLRVCLVNRTDLQDRKWYRGKHDVMEIEYQADWGWPCYGELSIRNAPNEEMQLWN